ncbi:MAG TPA: DUF4340 domain-containing protein [bacterium]|nr:DUF4340 domain-containing protein [bacterium]
MNLTRSNLVLSGLCLLLAVPTTLQLLSEVDSYVDVGGIPAMFDGFTSDNVGSIVLAEPLPEQPEPAPNQSPEEPRPVAYEQLVLVRGTDGWQIGTPKRQAPGDLAGAPVMKSRVENDVFEHLRAIRVDRDALVQPEATEEQLARYGLDEQHAFVVRCVDRAGKHIVAELLVGNDASQGRAGTDAVAGVFVRRRDSNDVVLYEWQRPWRRDLDPQGWLDRTLFRLQPDKVKKLAIRNGSAKRTFTFVREPGKARWQALQADDLGAVRQAEVEALVQRLQYFGVQAFERPLTRAGDMSALGLYPPQIEITLVYDDEDGEHTRELHIGGKVDGRNERWLECSGEPFLMTLPAGRATQFELDVARRLFDPKGN